MTAPAPVARIAVALGAVYLIWGSVYLAIRLVIEDVDPFQAMAQRFLVAGLLLCGWVAATRGWRRLCVRRAELVGLALTGTLLLGLGNGLQAWGQLAGVSSGVAALIVATVPGWVALLRLLDGERSATPTLLGVGCGLAGLVVLVLLSRDLGGAVSVIGVALVLCASISWSVGSFVQGKVPLPGDVLVVVAYQQLAAAVCSLLLAVGRGESFSMDYSVRGWGAMAYLVLVCSIGGFTAYAWLLTHVRLSLVATHAYVNPVVAVLLGWLVLAEPVGVGVLAGGGLVVAAVVLIVSGERLERVSIGTAPRPSVSKDMPNGRRR